MSKRYILLIFIALPIIIFFFWPSDERRIKKLFKEGSVAIEKEDIDAVMSKVSFNYTDDFGFNYLYVKESLKSVFQQMNDIRIEYENLKIHVKDKTATADMEVRIVATLGGETGYILGDLPNPAHITFTLEKERTKWLVIKTEGIFYK